MLISVIVPVYNTEKFLNKCVDSIVNQTFRDFELILVDDGSKDSSPEICDRYAAEYDFIRVIHKENGGPSAARNMAALTAEGDFITFIDSDDYVSADYLQTLHEVQVAQKVDICAALQKMVLENESPDFSKNGEVIRLTGKEALMNMLYQRDIDTTPCGILFRKDIVLNNPFPVGRYHEDDFTMFRYYLSADSVAICRQVKYHYVQHENSIMHSGGIVNYDELDAADSIAKYFGDKEPELRKAALSKKFSDYCQVLIKCPEMKKQDPETYRRITHFLNESKWTILFDTNTRIKNKAAAASLILGPQALRLLNKLKTNVL